METEMNVTLSEDAQKLVRSMAEKLGVSPEHFVREFLETRLKEYENAYPPDEIIAIRVAQDPDAAPLYDWETLKRRYKPMPPLDDLIKNGRV